MITNYQKDNVMDFLFGKADYAAPSILYLGLSTTEINEDGTGATEPSGSGYERVAIENNKTSFSSATDGVVTNAAQFVFPESTDNWGTITHVFISDGATDGNILYSEALTKERLVQEATNLTFPVGSLSFILYNKA